MCCIKGGKDFKSKNTARKTSTFRNGCQANFFVKLTVCGKYLEIVSKNEEHNHPCSENMFNALPHERLNLPKELKEKVSVVYALLWADYTGTNIWFYSLFQLKSEMSTTHLSGLNLQQFNKRCFKKNRMK